MLKTQLFAEKILYLENVLENPYEILNIIEEADYTENENQAISKWYTWQSSSNDYIFGQKKDLIVGNLSNTSESIKAVFEKLNDCMDIAQKVYEEKTNTVIGTRQPMCINKYFTGKMMGPHIDGSEESSSNPVVSAVLYINDNYDGGELAFPNQDIVIKPSAGSIVMFPSTSPFVHDPREILSGQKIMCPSFWFKD